MSFSINIDDGFITFSFVNELLSLTFYPILGEPDCLTEDGYYCEESGGECSFNICRDSNTISFYLDTPKNGTLNIKLKFTEEMKKSYYDSIEKWRKYLEDAEEEDEDEE